MHMLQVDLLLPLGILLQLALRGRDPQDLITDRLHILLAILLLGRVNLLELWWLRLQFGFVLWAWLLVVEVLRLRAACLTRLFSGVEHR
jgi:hypothetical protein